MKDGTTLTRSDRAIIIIGDPGVRKTTLALHFPKPYFFDCDGNMSAPVEYTKIREFNYDSSTSDDAGVYIPALLRYQHCIRCMNSAVFSSEVDTIIIDSLTTFSDIILSEVMRQEHGGAHSLLTYMKKSPDDRVKDQKLMDVINAKGMRIQDWGKFLFLLKGFVLNMRTCGKTFVIISHNNYEKDEVDGRFKQFINVPGQSKTTMSGLFTDCWHVFMSISGLGDSAKHEVKVRTLPISDTDHRGIKSSFPGLKRLNSFEEVIKVMKELKPEPKPEAVLTNQ
jgi:hypothetical protein